MVLVTRRQLLRAALAATIARGTKATAERSTESDFLYHVRDPLAGYFDLVERRQIMRELPDLVVTQARLRAMDAPNCQRVNEIPVQNQRITIPSFYEDNAGWWEAVKPFRDFEDAVSNLAAANLVSIDRRYAECLIDLLTRWADRDGLTEFNYSSEYKQGWFQVESTLFAIGHALAAVRPDVQHRSNDLKIIDDWLLRVGRSHFAIPGSPGGTCCNNHFYRRALYAAIIGVLTGDHQLFSSGMSAIHSALSEATSEGALPLEMARGELAGHYQNYSLMYLAMIAEIGARQGYSMWDMEIKGKSLHTLVDFNNRIMADANVVLKYSDVTEVSLRYREDMQYFAWYEIYLARFPNPQMEAWIARRRPLYNRSLGGHLTAYYYNGF